MSSKLVLVLGSVALLFTANGWTASLDCGTAKFRALASYERCLDKVLTKGDATAKCDANCTKAFTRIETNPKLTCAVTGESATQCGPASSTFAEVTCRVNFFKSGDRTCFP